MESAPHTEVSAPLAELTAAVRSYQGGGIADEAMNFALEQFGEKLAHLELPHYMPGTETRQPGVNQTMQIHEAAFQAYRSGFEELQYGLSEGNNHRTEEGLASMAKADVILKGLFDIIRTRYQDHQRKAEEAATIQCPQCGHRNQRGGTSCQQCRFMLPLTFSERTETDIVGGGGEVNAMAAVEALRTLAHSGATAQLKQRLEALQNTYRQGLKGSQDALRGDRIHAEVKEAIRGTITTLQNLLQAVEQAQAYVARGDTGSLDGPFSALEAGLHELDEYRTHFGELQHRFS
ncbi:MAG TPA: hypothetical protein VGO93_02285 [Candidatus Xenobia bacterium]|jgi:hypothetical protein